jgi:hypothetical protein
MAGLTTAQKNAMLDLLDGAPLFSLHSADPGATGANELSGGAPAYGRKNGGWNAAAASSKTGPASLQTFDVPAGSTVAYVGYWTAGVTFKGSRGLSASETYTGQVQYQLAAGAVTEQLT